jgi:hypothetical protein
MPNININYEDLYYCLYLFSDVDQGNTCDHWSSDTDYNKEHVCQNCIFMRKQSYEIKE